MCIYICNICVYVNIHYYSFLLALFEVIVPTRVRTKSTCVAIQTHILPLQSWKFSEIAYASILWYHFGMLVSCYFKVVA